MGDEVVLELGEVTEETKGIELWGISDSHNPDYRAH